MKETQTIHQDLLNLPFNHHTDFTVLADNCEQFVQSLTQLLLSRTLCAEMACEIEDLLCELVNYLGAMMKAPRWINTPEGRVLIEDILH